MLNRRLFFLLIILIGHQRLIAQSNKEALNNFIVYAQTMDKVEIDGDLSDWPKELKRYPIENKIWGADLSAQNDLKSNFRIGYSLEENVIYVAVEIIDDDHIENAAPEWNNQDSYIFYIDEQYKIEGSVNASYTLASNFKNSTNIHNNWDPEVSKYVSWQKMDYKIKTKGTLQTIEIKYQLNEPINTGRIIGLGHLIFDKDNNEHTALGWIGKGAKGSSAQIGSIGAVVFSNNDFSKGILKGQVVWEDSSIKSAPEDILVTSAQKNQHWFHVRLDKEGKFSTELPVGDWIVQPAKISYNIAGKYYKVNAKKQQKINVRQNSETDYGIFTLETIKKPSVSLSEKVANEKLDPETQKQIENMMNAYMEYYNIPGASFAIWKEEEIIYKGSYGIRNNYTKEKINQNTLFEVASITKPTFSFVVMRLVEKGIIDLDEPLYQYLEFDLIKGHPYAKLITARHVLSHQTGFPNWSNGEKIEFKFEPGNGYSYSGEGFEYLKRVLVKLTGKSINQIFQEELIEPLNLKHFYYLETPYALENKSNGHYYGYPGLIDFRKEPRVASSLVTNPEAFLEFANAIHNRKGLSAKSYEELFQMQNTHYKSNNQKSSETQEHVGLGWFIDSSASNGKIFKHSGSNGDFLSLFKLYDDLGVAFMITCNSNTGWNLFSHAEEVLTKLKLID